MEYDHRSKVKKSSDKKEDRNNETRPQGSDSIRNMTGYMSIESMSPQQVMYLQRTMGNQSVVNMLRQEASTDQIQRNIFDDASDVLTALIPKANYTHPIGDGTDAEQFWKSHMGGDVGKFLTTMLGDIAEYLNETDDDVEVTINEVIMRENQKIIQLLVQLPGGQFNSPFIIDRNYSWTREGGLIVDNKRTDVRSDNISAKKIFQNTLPLYKELGFDKMELSAVETGRYAWARYGFVPKDASEWLKVTTRIKKTIKDNLENKLDIGSVAGGVWNDGKDALKHSVLEKFGEMNFDESPNLEKNSDDEREATWTEKLTEIMSEKLQELFEDAIEDIEDDDQGLKIEQMQSALFSDKDVYGYVRQILLTEPMVRELYERSLAAGIEVGEANFADGEMNDQGIIAGLGAFCETAAIDIPEGDDLKIIIGILKSEDPRSMRGLAEEATKPASKLLIQNLLLKPETPSWKGVIDFKNPDDWSWITRYAEIEQ